MSRPLRIVIISAVVVAVVAIHVVRRHAPVSGVDIKIEYLGGDTLETAARVQVNIKQKIPNLSAMRVKDVDTRRVESVVRQSPYLKDVWASMSLTGKLVVRAEQRQPVARVFCGDSCFYIDREGGTVPLSTIGKAHVIIVSGHFDHSLLANSGRTDFTQWLRDKKRCHYRLAQLWRVVDYLQQHDDPQWRYDQIYINAKGDFCLVPRWANFTIVLGDADNLDEKMEYLHRFVDRALPVQGWDTYSELSLKYKGQIVCRRK